MASSVGSKIVDGGATGGDAVWWVAGTAAIGRCDRLSGDHDEWPRLEYLNLHIPYTSSGHSGEAFRRPMASVACGAAYGLLCGWLQGIRGKQDHHGERQQFSFLLSPCFLPLQQFTVNISKLAGIQETSVSPAESSLRHPRQLEIHDQALLDVCRGKSSRLRVDVRPI